MLPEPLSAAAFAPFGEVLDPDVVGAGSRRFFDSFRIVSPHAEPRCWISRFQPVIEGSISVEELEAHPHSAQVFVAMQPCRFLIVVAQADALGQPEVASCRAFVADRAGGLIYRSGVWHAGMMVLDTSTSFFVVQGLVAEGNDVKAQLARPIAVCATGRAP
ncbi:ureidoglycolate lyase [Borborobacter arsenicus]|nr:ureidoglycolate lyase [Pseudaminobacter arsenicus]